MFTEVLLIAQYTYLIPTRLHCGAITSRLQAGFEKAGLHGNAFRCIPVFCVYLAILMHTYSLVRQKVGSFHCIPKGNASANSSAYAQSLPALPSSCAPTAYSFVRQEVSRLVPILPAGQVPAQDSKTFSSSSAEVLSDFAHAGAFEGAAAEAYLLGGLPQGSWRSFPAQPAPEP